MNPAVHEEAHADTHYPNPCHSEEEKKKGVKMLVPILSMSHSGINKPFLIGVDLEQSDDSSCRTPQ